MRYFFLIISILGLGIKNSQAQDTGAWSLQFPLPELTEFVNLPAPVERIEQILKDEDEQNDSFLKTWVVALNIKTLIEPQASGRWDTIPGLGYVWRIGIHSENAQSLSLLIENFRMQPGMELYVYNKSLDNIAGPFDARNNANGGLLAVQALPGDMLIVEWNIPFNSQLTIVNSQFSITSVGYGFRNSKIISSGKSGKCQINVNCKTGNHWQREKRSVVLLQIISVTKDTIFHCTGTLVNQAVDAGRKKPYILTARHCISTPEQAQSIKVYFGQENLCGENRYLDVSKIKPDVTGAILRVAKKELDLTLLELKDDITALHPFYAGWNVSQETPQSVTGIHHPNGDFKKISVSIEPLGTGTFSDKENNIKCDENAHWLVKRWNEGSTEGGSSGSSIFDEEHRIVGVLSGGKATCSNPVNDFYSKFSEMWNRYKSANESLQPWLDPDNKGVTSLYGYDPVTSFEGRCDTLGHIGRNESKTLIESGTKGYLTGLNDRNWISFAEKIINDTVAHTIGMEAHVAKVFKSGSRVRFSIWEGDDFPVKTLYVKDMIVTADYANYSMHIYFDETLKITGNYFIGYCLEYSDPEDDFSVYQSKIRQRVNIPGMYVEEKNGIWMPLTEYVPPIYTSLAVRAMGRFGQETKPQYLPTDRELKIISQRGSDRIVLLFDVKDPSDLLQSVKIGCFDTSGKQMLLLSKVMGNMDMYSGKTYLQVEIDVAILPPGMYLIQAMDKNNKWSGKFVRLL